MVDNTNKTAPSLIKFPCDFVVKVMGKANQEFEASVISIILNHYPDVDLENIVKRLSSDQRFMAMTITVKAQNRKELDALYKELTEADTILFTL